MGYYVYQTEQDFFVPSHHVNDMVRAIHKLAFDDSEMSGGSSSSKHYAWVDTAFVNCSDAAGLLRYWRWAITFDEDNNIIALDFDGEKLGDDHVLMKAIAPFVKDGSYIQMRGEDDAMWRWLFEDGTCVEIYPRVIWG